MDFFSRQDDAVSRSRKFYAAFALAILFSVAALYLAVCIGYIFGFGILLRGGLDIFPDFLFGDPPQIFAWRPFLIIGGLMTVIILLVSLQRNNLLKEFGGLYVAELLGGRPLDSPSDFKETQLVNIVEEMAVAAALPRPHVYILPGAHSINAITAGTNPDNTVIAVTEGALKHLERDELQGVVAHEFAHILNGDYSLNLTMAGWLYGLLFIYIKGRQMIEAGWISAERDDLFGRPQGGLLNLILISTGIIIMIGGLIGKTTAQLVQAAFSRQREYLADAFAVQFTRNPGGLAGAMKKIAWSPRRGAIPRAEALSMDGFFIVSPVRFGGLLETHPPLEDRIMALDPAWDGEAVPIDHDDFKLPKGLDAKFNYHLKNPRPSQMKLDFKERLAGKDGFGSLLLLNLLAAGGQSPVEANEARQAAAKLYEGLPEELRRAASDPASAAELILAALMDQGDEAVLDRQAKIVESLGGAELLGRVRALAALMTPNLRLPLLEMAAPTLAALAEDSKAVLVKAVRALAAADGRLDLFEVAASQILKKSLGRIIPPGQDDETYSVNNYLEQTRRSAVTVLSLLAWQSSENAQAAGEALAAGLKNFTQWPPYELMPREELGAKTLIAAFEHLGGASDQVKKNMILAAASTALHDHEVSDREQMLLTALAAALDLPRAFAGLNCC